MSDLLIALLFALAVLVVAFPMLRWAVRAEKRADDRIVMGRVYYPTRGRKAVMPPFRRRAIERRKAVYERNDEWLIDLDVDEWDDQT